MLCYQDLNFSVEAGNRSAQYHKQAFLIQQDNLDPRRVRDFASSYNVTVSPSELDLINDVVDRINELDPDIVVGWEIMGSSWGYLCARAKKTFG